METVGGFAQQTIYGAVNVVKQRTVQKLKVADFARLIKADKPFAAFASFQERGNRNYWLFCPKGELSSREPGCSFQVSSISVSAFALHFCSIGLLHLCASPCPNATPVARGARGADTVAGAALDPFWETVTIII